MANIRLYCNKFTINNTDVVLIKSEGIKIKIKRISWMCEAGKK